MRGKRSGSSGALTHRLGGGLRGLVGARTRRPLGAGFGFYSEELAWKWQGLMGDEDAGAGLRDDLQLWWAI